MTMNEFENIDLSPIEPLLADPDVAEIMVNGLDGVYIEKRGQMIKTDVQFDSEDQVEALIQRIVTPLGRTIEQIMRAQQGNPDLATVAEDVLRMVEALGVDHVGLGTDLNGGPGLIADYAQLDAWTEGLRAVGLSAEETRKVAGGNAWRLLGEVLSEEDTVRRMP